MDSPSGSPKGSPVATKDDNPSSKGSLSSGVQNSSVSSGTVGEPNMYHVDFVTKRSAMDLQRTEAHLRPSSPKD